jgi:vancomycin resistance protein YoaR
MTPVLVSVDKAGDLKLGARKCRLYKKDEVVKVAKKYGINTEKKTVQQLCGSIKAKAKNSMNNVPLAKMYPEAVKKRVAAKKRVEKKALDKKIAANFMRNMTVKIPAPRPKPRSPSPTAVARARANIKNMVNKRVSYMNSKSQRMINQASPRAVMRIARELRRLR